METLIIIVAGVLVTVAVYLLLSKNLIRVIIGTAVLTHAVHLLIMATGGVKGESVTIDNQKETTFADALPQALVLTSIVISFAVSSFFLVLAYQSYKYTKTANLDEMIGEDHDTYSCFTIDFSFINLCYFNCFTNTYWLIKIPYVR